MVPQVGQKIGPYEILGRLGTGGMGLVFSAWDSRLHRDVAIKLLREEFLTPTMRSRFLGEARAASRLNHPNICTIFDIGEHDGVPYLVMELLKGQTLRGRMQQGAIPVEDIFCVAEDVADALSVAHGQGIVHRDIKPANIVLVDKPGGRFQTKVLDFGLAKIELEGGLDVHAGLTTTGMTVGTVSYMSPEQARGELLDGRSDLFSLGVVLYEMATRQLPFSGATSALVFVQLLNHPPESIRDLNGGIPKALEQIIATCLQKDRNARFQSAHDMVEAIHRATSSAPPPQKQNWLGRLAAPFRKSDGNDAPPVENSAIAPDERTSTGVEEPAPRPASSGESLLRPVKPILSSGSDRGVVRNEGFFPQPLPPGRVPPMPLAGVLPPSSVNGVVAAPGSSVSEQPQSLSSPDVPAVEDETAVPKTAVPTATNEELRSPSSRRRRLEWVDYKEPVTPVEEGPESDEEIAAAGASRRWRVIVGAVVLLLLATATLFVLLGRRIAGPRSPVALMLAPVANHTGDDSLNGSLVAALELALNQSPYVSLRGGPEFRAVMAANGSADDAETPLAEAEHAAKAAGAGEFVLGDVRMEGPGYRVTLQVFDAESGRRIATCSESAPSKRQLPSAMDGVAADLRTSLGETADSLGRASLPLSREGSANLDALQAYGSGEQLEASGHAVSAIAAFQRAVALDPQFTRAHLHLADILYRQHAEISAANAATQARAAAASAGDLTRTLAEAAYSTIAQGDYPASVSLLKKLQQRYPLDVETLDAMGIAQRLQGAYPEALQTARDALHLAPGDRQAADTAELSLLGLDNSQAAVDMTSTHALLDGTRPPADILVSFLSGSGDAAQAIASSQAVDDFAAQAYAASAFDAGGQFQEGAAKWRDMATRAMAMPELASAASYALSQGALDRALASDCVGALALLHDAGGMPAGPEAFFALGAASVLCGDLDSGRRSMAALSTGYAQSFAVKAFYISDLNALIQWKSGAPANALVSLTSASQYDSISLTPYLRGLVYMAQRQPQPAIVEFQAMLRHRGAAALINPDAFPAAQVAAARAYAANSDNGNSAQAYGALLTEWAHANQDTPLLAEAHNFAR